MADTGWAYQNQRLYALPPELRSSRWALWTPSCVALAGGVGPHHRARALRACSAASGRATGVVAAVATCNLYTFSVRTENSGESFLFGSEMRNRALYVNTQLTRSLWTARLIYMFSTLNCIHDCICLLALRRRSQDEV
jgi:hypothetical protein